MSVLRIVVALVLLSFWSPPAGAQPVISISTPSAASTPPATQNTITTTAPVTSETTISVGTLAGQLLNWVVLAFSGPIGGIVVWILVRVLKKLGIDATDALRARFQEIVVNGLNSSAKVLEDRLAGQGKIAVKNAIVAQTVVYTQEHAADTIKALGLDPQSGEVVQAIRARIETAIADPLVATPKVLDPPVIDPGLKPKVTAPGRRAG